MPKIHGYIRASTAGQQYTYEAQTNAIKPHMDKFVADGGELGSIYKDSAVSGSTEIFERPSGLQLWADLERGDRIVFAKLDRGFRNFLDYAKFAEMMKQRDVSFVTADLGLDSSTPMGQFVYQVMASFAQLEREFISIRTKEGLAVRHEKRLPSAKSPPPGWRKLPNGEWDKDDAERKVISWMERQRAMNFSYRQIARQLKDWGIRRSNDTQMSRHFVQIALFAKSQNYPGLSGWRQDWLKHKAVEYMKKESKAT